MIEKNFLLADLAIKRKVWPRREQDVWVVFENRSYQATVYLGRVLKGNIPKISGQSKKKTAELLELGGRCYMCDENDLVVLETHHVDREKYPDFIVPLCSNCHTRMNKIVREAQRNIKRFDEMAQRYKKKARRSFVCMNCSTI